MEERISNLEGALGHVQGVLKSHLEAYIAQANQRLDAIDSSCDSAEQSWGAATANATCTALHGGELKGAITEQFLLASQVRKQKRKIEKNAQAKKIILEEKRVNEIVLTEATEEMNELIHQDKLNDLISKQPNFEDALRSQIEVFANNRLQGLSFGEEETDTKAIGDKIIARMNTLGDFSQPTWIWRDARGDYQEKIKQICDAKLKGENITSSFADSRFAKIQNVLRQQETSLFK